MPREGQSEGEGAHDADRTQMTAAVWGAWHLWLRAEGWTDWAGIRQEEEETSGVHLPSCPRMCMSGIGPVKVASWRDDSRGCGNVLP